MRDHNESTISFILLAICFVFVFPFSNVEGTIIDRQSLTTTKNTYDNERKETWRDGEKDTEKHMEQYGEKRRENDIEKNGQMTR